MPRARLAAARLLYHGVESVKPSAQDLTRLRVLLLTSKIAQHRLPVRQQFGTQMFTMRQDRPSVIHTI
jgi:hypothetical protein